MTDSPAGSRTLLFLHAHPDDECILTGVTIWTAIQAGWRVVVAYATRGDAGETSLDLGGQTLGERRAQETEAACAELGVHRLEWLGYEDSGMVGTATTEHPDAFCNADPAEVAQRVAARLADERIDVVVGYDRNGQYGHPDHVAIHGVTDAVAAAVDAAWILESSYNRDYLLSLEQNPYGELLTDNPEGFASSAAELTHFAEGREAFFVKASAISNHRSQTPDDWEDEEPSNEMMEGFASQFGTEWYLARPNAARPDAPAWPLDGVLSPSAEWSGAPPKMFDDEPASA